MRPAVIRAYALGIITGSFITAGAILAAPAKADVATDYASLYGMAVCSTLDVFPSADGLTGIGLSIMDDGLSARQAGKVVALSVAVLCPRHAGLVDAYTAVTVA
jgi:hypothetical protein